MSVRKKIEKVINVGADVKNQKKIKSWTHIKIRILESMIEKINEKIDERPMISRNAWILEAIQEKLNKKNE